MDPAPESRAGAADVAAVDVLHAASTAALEYATSVDGRRVAPDSQALAALAAFDEPLPDVGARRVGDAATAARRGQPGNDGQRPALGTSDS